MNKIDKQIKRIKDEDERLKKIFELCGHTVLISYDLRDSYFTSSIRVGLEDGKVFFDFRLFKNVNGKLKEIKV